MEIKKILWPTDFSDNSNSVLWYVQSLSKKFEAEIYLLYVAEDLTDYGNWYGELTPDHAQKLRDWEVPLAQKNMDGVCEKDLQGCPLFHKVIEVGDPATKILEVAEREGIDVIIMATHGRHGGFQIGSVTDKVVKNAKVPVWTARPTGKK